MRNDALHFHSKQQQSLMLVQCFTITDQHWISDLSTAREKNSALRQWTTIWTNLEDSLSSSTWAFPSCEMGSALPTEKDRNYYERKTHRFDSKAGEFISITWYKKYYTKATLKICQKIVLQVLLVSNTNLSVNKELPHSYSFRNIYLRSYWS